MCGIIGSTDDNISVGLDSIAHRGPDSRDIKSVSGFNLGHVRLSIMDTSYESIQPYTCLLYTSPSPRDRQKSRMPASA